MGAPVGTPPSTPDAADILGRYGDRIKEAHTQGVDDIARQVYDKAVQTENANDLCTMYHPNGTTSLVLLPPIGRGGRGIVSRRKKLMRYIMEKRGPKGEQWWFASPPDGWEPQGTPLRCPVQGCSRAGGLPDLLNLWRHIQQKHPGEVPLYQGLLNAIQLKLQGQLEPDLSSILGLNEPQSDARCIICGYTPDPGKDAVKAMRMHRLGKHRDPKEATLDAN